MGWGWWVIGAGRDWGAVCSARVGVVVPGRDYSTKVKCAQSFCTAGIAEFSRLWFR